MFSVVHCINRLTLAFFFHYSNRVVSGSRDATLRVWDIVHGRCLHTLVGHLAAVRCVQYDGKLVVSGAYDYNVKVWNPETEECLHTLVGHTNRVYSLQVKFDISIFRFKPFILILLSAPV